VVSGLMVFDHSVVDGAVEGQAAAMGGLASRARRWQNGYVRSYALSLLGGAVLVVLALLVVNLA
jgi:NADH-quinone oxidoreductase subunit L